MKKFIKFEEKTLFYKLYKGLDIDGGTPFMLNGKYTLTKGLYIIEEKEHIGYGIRYRDSMMTKSFEDISMDRAKIIFLLDLCNSSELSPIHFSDVLEDFLAEN